jgi:hypothetical protein
MSSAIGATILEPILNSRVAAQSKQWEIETILTVSPTATYTILSKSTLQPTPYKLPYSKSESFPTPHDSFPISTRFDDDSQTLNRSGRLEDERMAVNERNAYSYGSRTVGRQYTRVQDWAWFTDAGGYMVPTAYPYYEQECNSHKFEYQNTYPLNPNQIRRSTIPFFEYVDGDKSPGKNVPTYAPSLITISRPTITATGIACSIIKDVGIDMDATVNGNTTICTSPPLLSAINAAKENAMEAPITEQNIEWVKIRDAFPDNLSSSSGSHKLGFYCRPLLFLLVCLCFT